MQQQADHSPDHHGEQGQSQDGEQGPQVKQQALPAFDPEYDQKGEDDLAAGAQVGAIGIDELAHKDIGVFNRHGGKHLIVLEGEQIAGDLVDAEKEADESRQQKADGQKQLQHTQGLQTLGYEKGV